MQSKAYVVRSVVDDRNFDSPGTAAVATGSVRSVPRGGLASVLAIGAVVTACSGGPPAAITAPEPEAIVTAATTGPPVEVIPSTRPAVPPTAASVPPSAPLTTVAALPAPTGGSTEWTLLAVGDVLMDDTESAGVDPFAAVVPPLATAGLAVVNAEMAIADGGVAAQKAFLFRAAPSAAARLAAAGVDVANLGNNHSLDYGTVALLDTIGHLRAAGVAPVGAGQHATEAFAPAVASVGGLRVAVIGASRVFPRRDWAALDDRPGIASAYDERRLLAAVRAARASADVVVVAVHWGQEGSPCPDADQVRLGSALLDAGAAVVLGSHPHVLQPIVSDARGVLAYSLGNFVFHRRWGVTGDSGVLEVRFSGAQIVGHRLHPHVLDDGPPRPAGAGGAARIAAAVANPCAPPPPPPVVVPAVTTVP